MRCIFRIRFSFQQLLLVKNLASIENNSQRTIHYRFYSPLSTKQYQISRTLGVKVHCEISPNNGQLDSFENSTPTVTNPRTARSQTEPARSWNKRRSRGELSRSFQRLLGLTEHCDFDGFWPRLEVGWGALSPPKKAQLYLITINLW